MLKCFLIGLLVSWPLIAAIAPPPIELPASCKLGLAVLADYRSHAAELVKELTTSRFKIDRTNLRELRFSRETRGFSNLGIYDTGLVDGKPLILKIWMARTGEQMTDAASDSARFQEYVVIHKLLGDLGYAPRLEGILPRDSVLKLIPFLKGLRKQDARFVSTSVLMQPIPNAWNITRGQNPNYVRKWSRRQLSALLERIDEMEAVCNELEIMPSDTQFFVTQPRGQDPKIYFGDLDKFKFRSSDVAPESFRSEKKILIKHWESATGMKFEE